MKPGKGAQAAYAVIRDSVPRFDEYRVLASDIEVVKNLMRSGEIFSAVEAKVGGLH